MLIHTPYLVHDHLHSFVHVQMKARDCSFSDDASAHHPDTLIPTPSLMHDHLCDQAAMELSSVLVHSSPIKEAKWAPNVSLCKEKKVLTLT